MMGPMGWKRRGSGILVPGGGSTDPLWDKVRSLLHFDGGEGGAVFTDQRGHTWAATGEAATTTSDKLFGTAAGTFDSSVGADDWISITSQKQFFDVHTGDVTIEIAFKLTAEPAGYVELFPMVGSFGVTIRFGDSGYGHRLQFAFNYSSTTYVYSSAETKASLNGTGWHRVSLSRVSGTARAFLDGAQLTVRNGLYSGPPVTSWTSSESINNVATVRIGKGGVCLTDEFRYTAAGRYAGSYTPETGAFLHGPAPSTTDPLWSDVVSLLHFNGADGGTTFDDEKGVVWDLTGTPVLNVANKLYGTAAGRFNSGDSITAAAGYLANFEFGTGDVTIDLAFKLFAVPAGYLNLFELVDSTFSGGLSIQFGDSGYGHRLQFSMQASSTANVYSSAYTKTNLNDGNYHWIRLTRVSGTARAFLDGNLLTVRNSQYTGPSVNNWSNSSDFSDVIVVRVGRDSNAYVDECRFTLSGRGVESYSVPDSAYPNS